jgi:hypothetical protein
MNTYLQIITISIIPAAMIISGIKNGGWRDLYTQFKTSLNGHRKNESVH